MRYTSFILLGLLFSACDSPSVDESIDMALEGGLDGRMVPDFEPDAHLDADLDVALPDAQLDGAPDRALPDAALPDAAVPGQIQHHALGLHPLNTPIPFDLPPGFDAVFIQAQGSPERIYGIVDLRGPGGQLVREIPGEGPLRTSFNPEVATALLPNTDDPRLGLEPGAYTFQIVADAEAEPLDVTLYFTARGGMRGLRINLLIPPILGRGIDDPEVVTMANALADKLADTWRIEAEVAIGLLADDAPLDLEINSANADLSGFSTLAQSAIGAYGSGFDVYLMRNVIESGARQGGLTGGLPAPIDLRGTAASVIAVRTPLLENFPWAVADLAVHEIGHALGLYHTTDPFGERPDTILDTPECPQQCDGDGDGILFARECGANNSGMPPCQGASDNLMFWTLGGQRSVTAGQRSVIYRHPALFVTLP